MIMQRRHIGLELLAVAWLVALLAAPQVEAAPPYDVDRYLADRQVTVSDSEVAIIEQRAYQKRGELSESRSLLAAEGVDVLKDYKSGVVLIEREAADSFEVEDVRTQLGAHVSPVLRSSSSPLRVIPLRRVIMQLRPGASIKDVSTALNSRDVTSVYPLRDLQYMVVLDSATYRWRSLEMAAELSEYASVEWAVPDCMREVKRQFLPDDVDGQWHVYNTNTVSATNSADFHIAWNTTLGDPNVVIAIIDDAVDIEHPDLAPNIWSNSGEIVSNGVDDDANGFIDDVTGWDFCKGTNQVAPDGSDETHGSSVAGLAAARGNNGMGVIGACPECRILPVKVFDGSTNSVTDSEWADAIEYAARYAKVINMSFSSSAALSAALETAMNNAQSSTVLFASSGNGADDAFYLSSGSCISGSLFGWIADAVAVGSGVHTARWAYVKDFSVTRAPDRAWLDVVTLPDGTRLDFESGAFPAGWSTGGDASWTVAPEDDDHIVVGNYSLRSGAITHDQTSWVEVAFSGPGTLSFFYHVMGERDCAGPVPPVFNFDVIEFYVDGAFQWSDSQEELTNNGFADARYHEFPSSMTSVCAVGASTIYGYRSTYSKFGTNMAFVAPSGGATDEDNLFTTECYFTNGSCEARYTNFNGTSASTPVAAGLAGLLYSANTNLTPQQVKEIMMQTARKIGDIAYTNGFTPRYGYGQIDAGKAMGMVISNLTPNIIAFDLGTNTARALVTGIETGRVYDIYCATNRDAMGEWDWTPCETNLMGAPIFGTNVTPYFEIGSGTPRRVFHIRK